MDEVETVVIGGGQAGLAVSHHLDARGLEHVVIERARVAERWRTQRWDSLMFQFPNWSIELPGRRYCGADPEGFSHRDQIVEFLESYATWARAPLRTGVDVRELRPGRRAGRYVVATDHGDLEAGNVVIATGPYQRPLIPAWSSGVPPDVLQLHAGDYRNPSTLPRGAVLVVGSGASGCQIVEELVEADRRVYFSVGAHRRVPRRYRGRDVFWWRRALGQLDQTAAATPEAQRLLPPLVTGVRGGHDIDIRAYASRGVTLTGRIVDLRDGRAGLAADLERNLSLGDEAFEAFVRAADAYLRKSGLDDPVGHGAPEPPERKASPASPEFLDLRGAGVRSVIWATGYDLDFGWVALPIFDARRRPSHRRGVTSSRGVYLVGLPWLHKAKSSFLYGVGEDAEHIADRISSGGS